MVSTSMAFYPSPTIFPPPTIISFLYTPPPSCLPTVSSLLPQSKFDPQHYSRRYFQCRGAGESPSQCISKIPQDNYISPQSNIETLFQKELIDTAECMATFKDMEKCQHYMEGLHKMLHYKSPPKTTIDKTKDYINLLLGKDV